MPLTTTTPATIANPEIPFDKCMVGLQIIPRVDNDSVTACVWITIQKYRINGGSVELFPAIQRLQIRDVYSAAASDPAVAAAIVPIQTALQGYITAKGL